VSSVSKLKQVLRIKQIQNKDLSDKYNQLEFLIDCYNYKNTPELIDLYRKVLTKFFSTRDKYSLYRQVIWSKPSIKYSRQRDWLLLSNFLGIIIMLSLMQEFNKILILLSIWLIVVLTALEYINNRYDCKKETRLIFAFGCAITHKKDLTNLEIIKLVKDLTP
jgi:hypothetical protein